MPPSPQPVGAAAAEVAPLPIAGRLDVTLTGALEGSFSASPWPAAQRHVGSAIAVPQALPPTPPFQQLLSAAVSSGKSWPPPLCLCLGLRRILFALRCRAVEANAEEKLTEAVALRAPHHQPQAPFSYRPSPHCLLTVPHLVNSSSSSSKGISKTAIRMRELRRSLRFPMRPAPLLLDSPSPFPQQLPDLTAPPRRSKRRLSALRFHTIGVGLRHRRSLLSSLAAAVPTMPSPSRRQRCRLPLTAIATPATVASWPG